jgi:hypothetical protein
MNERPNQSALGVLSCPETERRIAWIKDGAASYPGPRFHEPFRRFLDGDFAVRNAESI